MTISELKSFLSTQRGLSVQLPGGAAVPAHFHLTELGEVTKRFIDCGGKHRHERRANFQLWVAQDYDHRLSPEGMLKIIKLAEDQLGLGDLEIEVEYQSEETIGKFGLEAGGNTLQLTTKVTACLALEECGIPATTEADNPAVLLATGGNNGCTPGGGCC